VPLLLLLAALLLLLLAELVLAPVVAPVVAELVVAPVVAELVVAPVVAELVVAPVVAAVVLPPVVVLPVLATAPPVPAPPPPRPSAVSGEQPAPTKRRPEKKVRATVEVLMMWFIGGRKALHGHSLATSGEAEFLLLPSSIGLAAWVPPMDANAASAAVLQISSCAAAPPIHQGVSARGR
jgi:hypothetical protein